jgi:hypothetical protein
VTANGVPRSLILATRMMEAVRTSEISVIIIIIIIITLMRSSLLKFFVVLYIALLHWKLLAFGFLFDVPETFPYSVFALLVKIVLLLDALQQLMQFAGT